MNGFGASGPYKAVYAHFGITPQAVARCGLATRLASLIGRAGPVKRMLD